MKNNSSKQSIWTQLIRKFFLLAGLLLAGWALPSFSNRNDKSMEMPASPESLLDLPEKSPEKAVVNRVEKYNAIIEEQAHLLSLDNLSMQRLSKIEETLLEVEQLALKEGISKLIDFPKINDIRAMVESIQKNT